MRYTHNRVCSKNILLRAREKRKYKSRIIKWILNDENFLYSQNRVSRNEIQLEIRLFSIFFKFAIFLFSESNPSVPWLSRSRNNNSRNARNSKRYVIPLTTFRENDKGDRNFAEVVKNVWFPTSHFGAAEASSQRGERERRSNTLRYWFSGPVRKLDALHFFR